jgi:hypothetical protein
MPTNGHGKPVEMTMSDLARRHSGNPESFSAPPSLSLAEILASSAVVNRRNGGSNQLLYPQLMPDSTIRGSNERRNLRTIEIIQEVLDMDIPGVDEDDEP